MSSRCIRVCASGKNVFSFGYMLELQFFFHRRSGQGCWLFGDEREAVKAVCVVWCVAACAVYVASWQGISAVRHCVSCVAPGILINSVYCCNLHIITPVLCQRIYRSRMLAVPMQRVRRHRRHSIQLFLCWRGRHLIPRYVAQLSSCMCRDSLTTP